MSNRGSTPTQTNSRPAGTPHATPTATAASTSPADLGTTMDRSGIIVAAGAVCAVLGAVSLVTQQIWGIVAGQPIETDTPIFGRILYAGQIALFVVAVVGLYLHQRKAFGTFGQIATLVALCGTLLWSGSTASEALATVDRGGTATADNISTPLLVWIFVAFGLYALGLLLFGIATWRAGVLPRVPAALVVLGIPAGLLGESAVPGILTVYGTGIAWRGLATLVQLRSREPARA